MAALTLVEAARLAANNGEDKRAGFLMTFAERSPLLAATPIEQIQGSAMAFTRSASLGSVAFRGVNQTYTPNNGATEELKYSLKAVGGEIDVDTMIVATGGTTARTTHEMMKAAAMAQSIGYHMVKGSLTTQGGATATPYAWDGLQAQYGGGFGSTAVSDTGPNAGQILLNTGGAGLSIASLDEAIQLVDNPTHLLMPKKQAINITSYLRNSASIQTSRDEFGRIVQTYNGLPILHADINGDTAALAYDENNSTSTSIYVLSLRPEACHLIEGGGGMSVNDLGMIDSAPVWRTRLEWFLGFVPTMGPRDVARLYGITNVIAIA